MKKNMKTFGPIIIAVGVLLLFSCSSKTYETNKGLLPEEAADLESYGNNDKEQAIVYTSGDTIELTASRFRFNPERIVIHKGSKVILNAKATDVTHSFAISEYGLNVMLPFNAEKAIELTADKEGAFTFYCAVPCGAGHRDMRGILVVE